MEFIREIITHVILSILVQRWIHSSLLPCSLEDNIYPSLMSKLFHAFSAPSCFLPTPLAGAWVNRWTFSPPLLLLSHLQSYVSLRYRTFLLGTENAVGGLGFFGSVCHLVFTRG